MAVPQRYVAIVCSVSFIECMFSWFPIFRSFDALVECCCRLRAIPNALSLLYEMRAGEKHVPFFRFFWPICVLSADGLILRHNWRLAEFVKPC